MGAMYCAGEDARHGGVMRLLDGGLSATTLQATITLKASGDAPDEAWTLIEYTVPPHFTGTRTRRAHDTSEGICVLVGTLTLHLDDQTVVAPAGSFVVVPAGVARSFANHGNTPVEFLIVVAPGGFTQALSTPPAQPADAQTRVPADYSRMHAPLLQRRRPALAGV